MSTSTTLAESCTRAAESVPPTLIERVLSSDGVSRYDVRWIDGAWRCECKASQRGVACRHLAIAAAQAKAHGEDPRYQPHASFRDEDTGHDFACRCDACGGGPMPGVSSDETILAAERRLANAAAIRRARGLKPIRPMTGRWGR